MGWKVCKFGGSSVATKEKIEQVAKIIEIDSRRRCIVLSAPGKAPGVTVKVTDLLIGISKKALAGENVTKEVADLHSRYESIYAPLGVKKETINAIVGDIRTRIDGEKSNPAQFRDSLAAAGEEYNARLFNEFMLVKGIKSAFISPTDIGMIVSSTFGDAQLLEKSRAQITALKKRCDDSLVIFPGFYGVTQEGKIATFSRGGSDLTGSICAEAIDAIEYENWTDVDGIFSTNPNIIESPYQIPALTYKEMRELSYIGFNVLHEEAVKPVLKKKIPIRLRNTNNLKNEGTLIVAERLPNERDVIGIASGGPFCSFTLQKFLMNREKGFGRRLLAIFENMDLSYEHCPSGVDSISVILDQKQLKPASANDIIRSIEEQLIPEEIKTEFDLALIAVVGEGLMNKIGVLAQAANALSKAGVNIKMANQGSSEISIIFGIDAKEEKKAVTALYQEFFG
jgi:aspartate kinase